jgi:hypothetical protein
MDCHDKGYRGPLLAAAGSGGECHPANLVVTPPSDVRAQVGTKALASGSPLPEVSTPRVVRIPEKMAGSFVVICLEL